ncbi:hypothetical protein B296_00048729 [Ensete ventricosum]|uniref:Uncharacterized protein n=1 Tax=Ensete ventricosum TaxID=4639 RepID=A0A426XAD2_ENSVE|nr:hypothetical protein B296_00048729 [Ensete ventricosum]
MDRYKGHSWGTLRGGTPLSQYIYKKLHRREGAGDTPIHKANLAVGGTSLGGTPTRAGQTRRCLVSSPRAQPIYSCACGPDHIVLIPRTRRITQQHFGARRRARCRKNTQYLATSRKMSLPRRNQSRGEHYNPRFHSLCSKTRTWLPTPQGVRSRIPSVNGFVWHVRCHNVSGFHDDSPRDRSRMRTVEADRRVPPWDEAEGRQALSLYLTRFTEEIRVIPDTHVEYPDHDDALAITARIVNTHVRRIMIDTGSSADILYLDSSQKLGMTNQDLILMTSTLTGFTEDAIAGYKCPTSQSHE